jgi:Zn-dependent peptidase ImmA (M78 family)
MPVSRIDLADAGSPEKLVALILKAEPNLPIPVPIEDLCRQLDIAEIKPLETEGFEGGLITDTERSSGVILVNEASHPYRRRFTVGHELAHFLIPTHMPDKPGRFLCSRADMMRLSAKESDRRARMEVEANKFSSLILIPPPHLRIALRNCREPDLQHIAQLSRKFEVSKHAMARAYAEYHPEMIAIVVVENGKVLWSYRDRIRFPFIQVNKGDAVPPDSLYFRGKHDRGVASAMKETAPENWLEVKRGERAPTLFEQIYLQQQGYALILLQLVKPDEEDEEEERSLEASWHPRFHR